MRCVGVPENNTFPGQAIEVWSFDEGVSGETHVPPSGIVEEDDDEVRPFARCRGEGCAAKRRGGDQGQPQAVFIHGLF
jgi:hypothetical protein